MASLFSMMPTVISASRSFMPTIMEHANLSPTTAGSPIMSARI